MKKNLIISLLFVAATMMVSSCKKEYLVDVNGNLNGKVYDQYNKPIEKALIVVEGTSLKDSTDADGSYSIKGISVGDYNVTISKTGYTTSRQTISINEDVDVSKKKLSYDVGVVLDGKLLSLTGKASGTVVLNSAIVANAKVIAYWTHENGTDYVTETYETTTDANGMYSFTALPMIDYNDSYYSSSSITIAGYDSNNSELSGSMSFSNFSQTSSFNISLSDKSLAFLSYTGANNALVDTLAANGKIVLTFSQNVSEEITQKMGGYVYLQQYYGNKLGTKVEYSGNTITITPIGNYLPNTTYEIEFYVFATETKATYSTKYFTTISRTTSALSGTPVITYTNATSGYYDLLKVTTPTSNATYYEVYASGDGVSDYVNIDYDPASTFTSGYQIYYSSYSKGAKFYVRPYKISNGNRVYGTISNIVTKQ